VASGQKARGVGDDECGKFATVGGLGRRWGAGVAALGGPEWGRNPREQTATSVAEHHENQRYFKGRVAIHLVRDKSRRFSDQHLAEFPNLSDPVARNLRCSLLLTQDNDYVIIC
jgi:hypothetical protein